MNPKIAEAKIAELRADLKELKNIADARFGTINVTTNLNAKLHRKLDTLDATNTSLNAQLVTANDKLKNVLEVNTAQENKISELETEKSILDTNLRIATKQRDDTQKQASKYAAELDNTQAELRTLKRLIPTPKTSALDTQKGGDHYSKLGEYQPWKVFSKWMKPDELKGFMKGTVIAYLAREEDKGGDLDIEKAYHTLGIYLELTANTK